MSAPAGESPTPATPGLRFSLAVAGVCVLLVAILASMVIWLRADLRREIHLTIIERDAAVLYPFALQEMAEGREFRSGGPSTPLAGLLKSAEQKGMLAVSVFDRDGNSIESVPANQLFVELTATDLLQLQRGNPVSRYEAAFPLDQHFAGVSAAPAPVLEVLLPLPGKTAGSVEGFVRYYIDARPLSEELAGIDRRINGVTAVTLAVGTLLIAAVTGLSAFAVRRAQRTIAERNERLTRTNFELTLAAKASTLGQITSHLIHGLQGPVEELRAVVAGKDADRSSSSWESAAEHADRLQRMIREVIALLGDASSGASYELTGFDLAATLREGGGAGATERGVILEVSGGFASTIDSHRGGLLCLIGSNLIHNAIEATRSGRRVMVQLARTGLGVVLTVTDEGEGIPEAVQKHLFRPGKSGRAGGSGLGLAISRLLARNIGAEIVLLATGPLGTAFRVTLPDHD
ncbi:MAG TPA: sensor histidine kinase [Opitutaceae bacterium]|jgi:signal transduction histidine kinase